MEKKSYKVKITAFFWLEVEGINKSNAATVAELDVEDVINQKNWELDEVLSEEVEEILE